MRNLIEIPATLPDIRVEDKCLRVAAYCRVSTDHEEQDTSIELQEQHYRRLIRDNAMWSDAGIFSERANGLNIAERIQFCSLLRKCRQGKVDLILTKSISRFGRNTLDMLRALRELRDLGVDVYFEKENFWLHDQHLEVLLTIYCAFAQAESESMSRNIKWGIKCGFQTGNSGYADFVCFGYKAGDNGQLAIDEPDAGIVRKIFEMRSSGSSLGRISDWLHENNIPSPTGKERWSRETISKLLRNEKYTGNVLLQKTFVKDLFSGKQVKNDGKIERFLIQNHHPAIVSRELFREVSPGVAAEIYG